MKVQTKGKDFIAKGKVYHADKDGCVDIPVEAAPRSVLIDHILAEGLEVGLILQSASTAELVNRIQNGVQRNSDEKQSLVDKALALKEANPKAVKASPSAIPAMSIEKLTALIAEAEAAIAAGGQE